MRREGIDAVSAIGCVWAARFGPDHGHDDVRRHGRVRQRRVDRRRGGRRQVDQCLDAGINLIDTANVYSGGLSEEILGKVLEGRRDQVLVATKARMPMGEGPNDAGLSRHHLIRECEASLRAAGHRPHRPVPGAWWDGQTPLDETLAALDDLVGAGKVRYVGCSNYAGWQLMKALGIAEQRGLSRFVSQQIHYTLQAREAEYELVPIAVDQGLGLLVWSPLAGGLLSGKYRRDQPGPEESRLLSGWDEPPLPSATRTSSTTSSRSWWRWRRARCLPGPGGAGLAAGAAGGHLGDYRRPHVRAAGRQPRRRRSFPDRRGAGAAGGGQPAAVLYPYWHQAKTAIDRLGPADLSLLAPHLAS